MASIIYLVYLPLRERRHVATRRASAHAQVQVPVLFQATSDVEDNALRIGDSNSANWHQE